MSFRAVFSALFLLVMWPGSGVSAQGVVSPAYPEATTAPHLSPDVVPGNVNQGEVGGSSLLPGAGDPQYDSDGDGQKNMFDLDDDNDGILDQDDSDPFDPTLSGIKPTPGILDPDADSDGDTIKNLQDPDDDNDGILDQDDSAPFDPSLPGVKPTPGILDPDADSDGDGIKNLHDPDDDNDGILDFQDCAPFDPNPCPASLEFGSVHPGGGWNGGSDPSNGGGNTIHLPNTGSATITTSDRAILITLTLFATFLLASATLLHLRSAHK